MSIPSITLKLDFGADQNASVGAAGTPPAPAALSAEGDFSQSMALPSPVGGGFRSIENGDVPQPVNADFSAGSGGDIPTPMGFFGAMESQIPSPFSDASMSDFADQSGAAPSPMAMGEAADDEDLPVPENNEDTVRKNRSRK